MMALETTNEESSEGEPMSNGFIAMRMSVAINVQRGGCSETGGTIRVCSGELCVQTAPGIVEKTR
jgi:hypothetical protein